MQQCVPADAASLYNKAAMVEDQIKGTVSRIAGRKMLYSLLHFDARSLQATSAFSPVLARGSYSMVRASKGIR